jgi:hypothetical protein
MMDRCNFSEKSGLSNSLAFEAEVQGTTHHDVSKAFDFLDASTRARRRC